MGQFIKSMFVVCIPFQKELLLDFVMYLVKQNSDITEAQELLNSKLSVKSFQSNILLRAYSGLFAYISWKKCRLQLEKRDLDTEDLGGWSHGAESATDSNLKRQVDFHGKQALVLFHDLVEQNGVWDIFLIKQVEVLKYYNQADEARRILERYKEKNPENPNAHRYLYYFLKSEDTDKQELCNVLEDLLRVDPTSELSEKYVKLRMHQADQSKGVLDALGALFVKLDHAACQQGVKTWETFADTLRQYSTTHDKKSLGELWDERADWWPQFHFRGDLVPKKDHVTELEWQLTQHKAKAARWLLGKGNPFTKAVRSQEKQDGEVQSCSPKSDTASPRKRKAASVYSELLSPLKRKAVHSTRKILN